MEKINIAELLKDCPKGMELDCTIYDECTLRSILESEQYPIKLQTPEGALLLTKYGSLSLCTHSKCVIFPKGKTSWEGFVPPCKFKDGDIVSTMNGIWIGIVKKPVDSAYEAYVTINGEYLTYNNPIFCFERFATEEEKARLFQAIKDNGYKWDEETKTLEKLVEPKEYTENKTVMAGIYFDREYYADEVELHLGNYEIEIRGGNTYAVLKNQETKISKPKFKLGDRIRHKCENFRDARTIISYGKSGYWTSINDWIDYENQDDWELVPNKFDINTLVPFESKVLVRNDNEQRWIPAFWGGKREDGYVTTFGWGKYCIPYEGNEHLLDKTDDCDEYYKTWK